MLQTNNKKNKNRALDKMPCDKKRTATHDTKQEYEGGPFIERFRKIYFSTHFHIVKGSDIYRQFLIRSRVNLRLGTQNK